MDEASTESLRSESHPESQDRGPQDIRCREAGWKAFLLHSRFPPLFIVVVLGFLVYSNTFYSPFQWDEAVYIADRPFIKDLTYFARPFLAQGDEGLALRNRYIGYLTFALNYKLHGFDVFGYHVVNLAIHLINAMLVYFFVLLTFRTPFFKSQKSEVRSQKLGNGKAQKTGNTVHSSQFKVQSPEDEEQKKTGNRQKAEDTVQGSKFKVQSQENDRSRKAGKPTSWQAGKGDDPPSSPQRDRNTPFPPLTLRGGAEGGGVTQRGEIKGGGSPIAHRPSPASDSLFTIRYSRFFAFIVALLFVAHPLQTEAVTYVFQRLASLVTLFYLLSLVLYIKGRLSSRQAGKLASDNPPASPLMLRGEQRGVTPQPRGEGKGGISPITSRLSPIAYYFFSILSAVLAMKTKENAFTLPLVIALYEFLFFTGPLKSRLLRLTPWLLTMLIIPATFMASAETASDLIRPIKDPGTLGSQGMSKYNYLYTQFRVIITYLRLLFLPVNQNLYHDYPTYRSLFVPAVFLSALLLAVLFGAAVWLIFKTRTSRQAYKPASLQAERGDGQEAPPLNPPLPRGELKGGSFYYSLVTSHYLRLVAFGILWFFITLSVESSIIPIPMLIDEYRVYLPSVGFFIAVAACALLLLQRFTEKGVKRSPSPSRGEGTVLNSLASSEERPPAETLPGKRGISSPVSPPLRGGDEGEGVGHSRFTIHDSRFAVVLFGVIILALASATYARNSLWKDKISLWEDVVRKSPRFPLGYNNLGIAYYEKRRYDKAIEAYGRAIAILPVYLDPYINLGSAYSAAGRPDMAVEALSRALEMYPDNSTIYFNMAHAYAVAGMSEKAAEYYLKVIKSDPFNSQSYHGLGTVYARLGRLDEAIAAYTKFVVLSPNDPEAYRNRGIIYAKKDDVLHAMADFQKACSLGSSESCGYLENGPSR
jgi:Flp pilus assembly protein TadD